MDPTDAGNSSDASDAGNPTDGGDANAGGDSASGISVVSVTLLDTSITNVVQGSPVAGYDPIANNATISQATVGTQLSIRANTNPSPTGSVNFSLDGTNHTESSLPYTLCGDDGAGTITNCNITQATHTLTVTPYSAAALGGDAGTPLTITFTLSP